MSCVTEFTAVVIRFLGRPKLLVEMVHKLLLLRTPTRKSRRLWNQEISGARTEAPGLVLNLVLNRRYTFTQCTIHTPYRSQYAAIALTTPCTSFTQILLTKRVIFSQALTLAPWRWFLCKPEHVGAFLSNLECFNNSAFFKVMCFSW